MKSKETKSGVEKSVQTSCSVPADLYEKLVKMAEVDDRSVSKMIVKAIREMIERSENPPKP